MNDLQRDLDDLGRRLWPSTRSLRPIPQATMGRRGGRRLAAAAVFAAATVGFGGILALSLSLRSVRAPVSHQSTASGLVSTTVGDTTGDGSATSLGMANATDGWAWGSVFVGRTTNGFHTLADVTPATISHLGSHPVGFVIDADHFWLVGTPQSGVGGTVALLQTSNGGSSWDESSFSFAPGIELNPNPLVTAISPNDGWLDIEYRRAFSFGHILYGTTDGGTDWNLLNQTILPLPASAPATQAGEVSSPNGIPDNCAIIALDFQNATDGDASTECSGTGLTLLTTTDGGSTWTSPPSPPWATLSKQVTPAIAQVPDIGGPNPEVALSETNTACNTAAGVADTLLYTSSNAGATWNEVGNAAEPGLVYFGVPQTQVLLVPVCAADPPLVSSDGGKTWAPAPSWPAALLSRGSATVRAFDVSSPSVAFALAYDNLSRVTTYYASTDGGATFSQVFTSGGGPDPTSLATNLPQPPSVSATPTSP